MENYTQKEILCKLEIRSETDQVTELMRQTMFCNEAKPKPKTDYIKVQIYDNREKNQDTVILKQKINNEDIRVDKETNIK